MTLAEALRGSWLETDWDLVRQHRYLEGIRFTYKDVQSKANAFHLAAFGGQDDLLDWALDSLPEEERARWEDANFEGTKALDMPNALERTPLHLACERGNEDCVRWLLEKLADPNAETLSGMMPLHFCCREKHAGCVKALLGQKDQLVDIDEDDASGKTADDYAQGHPRIRRELQRYRVVRKRLFRDELIGRYTRPIFKFFDISGDNSISKSEYISLQTQLLEICGEEVDRHKILRMFSRTDVDKDNKISYEEFKAGFEDMTNTLGGDISQIITAMKKVRRKITCVTLSTVIPIDPEASSEFRSLCESLLLEGQANTAIRKCLNLQCNVLLKEKSEAVALVVSDEIGDLGMSLHLTMNPSWVDDLIFILTPIELSP
jgi:hypothetical protein